MPSLDPSELLPKSSSSSTLPSTQSAIGTMTPRELSSKPTLARTPHPRHRLLQASDRQGPSRPTPIAAQNNLLHSSAAAPRQSEAFKRLGQASLVSSSIFKSALPSTSNPPRHPPTPSGKPSSVPSAHPPPPPPSSRPASNHPRVPGRQSQMAAALQGLGITSQVITTSDFPRPTIYNPPPPPPPTRSTPSTIAQASKSSGTKRKSDENLPLPPRPPPNLSLNTIDPSTPAQKPRPPPRQSLAFNALTRNALVSSSPFKAPGSSTPATKNSPSLANHSRPTGPVTCSATSQADPPSSPHRSPIITPGTPPSPDRLIHPLPSRPSPPRPSGPANGVLKSQRLGGPRSFTPPHSPLSPSHPSDTEDHRMIHPVPSALSNTSRRHERRKTVTWGGEDVLEFEWEEEWRRSSLTSSSDSASPGSDTKSTNSSSDSSSDFETRDPPRSTSDPFQARRPPHQSESWSDSASPTHQSSLKLDDPDGFEPSSTRDEDDTSLDHQSHDSLVIRDDSQDSPSTDHHDLSRAEDSFSTDTDPVDQMVNELLTSPDLAAHINSQATRSWPISNFLPGPDLIVPTGSNVSPPDVITQSSRQPTNPQPSSSGDHHHHHSRFPYFRTETSLPPPEQDRPMTAGDARTIPDTIMITEDESSDQVSFFQPISLPSLGLEDSLFAEASMISSVLESSTLNVESLETASSAASQPMLSSTPRASYTDQLPSPNPSSPSQYPPSSAVPMEVEDTSSKTITHTSPRRPLPRPPPSSLSPQTAQSSSLPGSSTSVSSAQPLPEVHHGRVRPGAEGMTSESDAGCESNPNSPGGTRPRITRQRIHDRMRDSDRVVKSGDESLESTRCFLPREPTSHSASIHKLGPNGEEERLELGLDVVMDSDRPTISTVTLGPSKEIQARPPLRAQQVQLPDSVMQDGNRVQETVSESDKMGQISSGLDKLARAFQDLEDGSKSCDSSTSIGGPDRLVVNTHQVASVPSKTIMIKGAGRRRRSLSTGGADLDETGTGTGAKAVVKSTPVKRYNLAVDKEASQITSALLFNTIQPGMSRTDLQEPLNKVLQKANDSRSYHVSESDEVVIASDHTMTAGLAGDVAANRNWRKLRKVSDINQHAAQLKAFWAQNDNLNRIGRVFVKMSKLVFPSLPPSQPPAHFQVIIDNGLHQVKTPFYKLEPEVTIGVEFELVRAKKLEFSLAFSIPLNEPLNAHLKPLPPPRPVSPPRRPVAQPVPPPTSGSPKRLFGFLGANSKRSSKHQGSQQKQQQIQDMERERASLARQLASSRQAVHPLVSLLDRHHVLATALVNFEHYAHECLGKWKQAVVPCVSTLEDPVKAQMQRRPTFTGPIGQVSLEFLSLPPIPKLPHATIPNSGSECLKGLKIAEWWQEVWHEGVLSQLGADCPTWRRRTFKATGGSLFAYNDIMKKLSAEIRLTEVVSLEDCGQVTNDENLAPKNSFINDQGEVLPPFTFRLVFKDGSEILFHADNQSDFKRWKSVLRQLLGKIQPLPAWAELLRLQIAARRSGFETESSEKQEKSSRDDVGGHTEKPRPVGHRLPGRRPRSPQSHPVGHPISTSSSEESELSEQTMESGTTVAFPLLPATTKDSHSTHPPGSSIMNSDRLDSHQPKLSRTISDAASSPRPTSSLLTSDTRTTTTSYRPTLSAMSATTACSGSTPASSVLSRLTSSSMVTSNPTTRTSSLITAPSSRPVQSQMKRSKGPVKL